MLLKAGITKAEWAENCQKTGHLLRDLRMNHEIQRNGRKKAYSFFIQLR